MVELFANSGDPDLGLHCLPIILLGVSRLQWVKPKMADIFLLLHKNICCGTQNTLLRHF